jgi:hypothetical protein
MAIFSSVFISREHKNPPILMDTKCEALVHGPNIWRSFDYPTRGRWEKTHTRLDMTVRCVQNCEKQLLTSSCLSVLPTICLSACNKSASSGWIFVKFDVSGFVENMSR